MYLLLVDRGEHYNVDDWTVAWTCTFDKEEVNPTSEEFKQVSNQISQPGDFSISSLFFAFTSTYGGRVFHAVCGRTLIS